MKQDFASILKYSKANLRQISNILLINTALENFKVHLKAKNLDKTTNKITCLKAWCFPGMQEWL